MRCFSFELTVVKLDRRVSVKHYMNPKRTKRFFYLKLGEFCNDDDDRKIKGILLIISFSRFKLYRRRGLGL